MHFHKSSTTSLTSNYSIGGNDISVQDTHRDLGILLQSNLNWTQHTHICFKAYKILGLLKRSFCNSNSILTMRKLYISLVRSQLSYCSPLWRPCLINDIRKLEQVQRRATKFVLGQTHSQNYKQRLIDLDLLPLMYYFELTDIMFLVNSLKCASDRFNILNYIQLQESNNTRSANKLTLKHIRSPTNQSQHFYFRRIPRLWNRLPFIDLSLSSETIKKTVYSILWTHFIENFDPNFPMYLPLCMPMQTSVLYSR